MSDFSRLESAWVAVPLSSRSSRPRNWTRVSCIGGRFCTSWTTREAKGPLYILISSSIFHSGKKSEIIVTVLNSLELKIWASVLLKVRVTKKSKCFSVAFLWHSRNITMPSIYFRMRRNQVLWSSLPRAQAKQISYFWPGCEWQPFPNSCTLCFRLKMGWPGLKWLLGENLEHLTF